MSGEFWLSCRNERDAYFICGMGAGVQEGLLESFEGILGCFEGALEGFEGLLGCFEGALEGFEGLLAGCR